MPSLETRAAVFAAQKHYHQRYGNRPYFHHLTKVVEVLERFGIDNPHLLAAGWLHDVIEDTDASYNDVKKATNKVVAELVFAVTDELGRNRKERARKTYPKIVATPGAVALKLADRIANVENGNVEGGSQFQMYQKEYPHFREAMQTWYLVTEAGDVPGEHLDPRLLIAPVAQMWEHLDRMMKPRRP